MQYVEGFHRPYQEIYHGFHGKRKAFFDANACNSSCILSPRYSMQESVFLQPLINELYCSRVCY